MVKTSRGALALALTLALEALPSARAFRNTSPFFLFSTADLHLSNTDASVAQASQVTAHVLEALKDCPTRSYILVQQPGVSSADYADGRSAPQLSQYMAGKQHNIKTTYAVPDVVGELDRRAIEKHLEDKCERSQTTALVAPAPEKVQRVQMLLASDDALDRTIDSWATSEDYTVIYLTTPVSDAVARAQLDKEMPPYEMESPFGNYDHVELKRDLSSHARRANSTNNAGLFERYQYFTPGLFMAFSAIVPLFLILLVGIRALTSLEVSYFAFSKEMGPNAQRKQ